MLMANPRVWLGKVGPYIGVRVNLKRWGFGQSIRMTQMRSALGRPQSLALNVPRKWNKMNRSPDRGVRTLRKGA